jgi:hypothetical protein
MVQPTNESPTAFDLEMEAALALELARAMPRGPERIEALKKAGRLQHAADIGRIRRPTKPFPKATGRLISSKY